MKVAIGNDRKGMDYKKRISDYLLKQGIDVINFGSDEDVPTDYPIYAFKVANCVANGDAEFGILICSSGIGMSIAANKVKGIRCGIAYNKTVAQKMREHNNANIIALGQDYIEFKEAIECVETFLSTNFLGMHHSGRIKQICAIENEQLNFLGKKEIRE